ncbi:L,D-transpeptidase [Fulvimarina sp. MAC3]|uniref:L,D-transpeptidase n=1 Tax=Fulvimarina sp. MAC3 TaxID=3148887 RepID=UPI0031FD5252
MKHLAVCLAFALGILTFGLTNGAEARLIAKIDLSSQRMTVINNGKVLYNWPVSTARKGYRTPTGTWRPKRIHRMWHSRKYDMSPMPYSVFYNGGYAIHGTGAISRLGRPASHGCVRLHPANAKAFYNLVRRHGMGNTRVVVQR